MGLLKAGIGSLSGVLADQWREFFYSDALDADTLITKGKKRVSGRSSNKSGDENIISNGSIVAVNEGQCMIIVETGKVVDLCAEAGEYVYDKSTEPTLLYGSLGANIRDTFFNMGKRFTFGGDTGKDQRVYYFNTKEIMGNKYGTPSPVPFRVIDKNIGLDVDISIRCHGEYSYKIVDPIVFYTNVSGNVEESYTRDLIDSQLKAELMTALQPALAKISAMGIRYSELPAHTMEMGDALNEVLSDKWRGTRGIAVASFAVGLVKASEEDEQMIKQLQRTAAFKDPTMAAAQMVSAQSEAMVGAAKNEGAGAFMAFAGMNMANQAGGINANNLYNIGQQQAKQAPAEDTWACACGTANSGKFCSQCGKQKPEAPAGWTCSCGAVNSGKFCSNCGKQKAVSYKCNKCGWEPKPGDAAPKFCPECGDVFNENDVK